jgi:hypothetical protein
MINQMNFNEHIATKFLETYNVELDKCKAYDITIVLPENSIHQDKTLYLKTKGETQTTRILDIFDDGDYFKLSGVLIFNVLFPLIEINLMENDSTVCTFMDFDLRLHYQVKNEKVRFDPAIISMSIPNSTSTISTLNKKQESAISFSIPVTLSFQQSNPKE